MAGAGRRPVTLRPPDFELDVDALRAAVTPRTRLILLNSPHNPTGKVFDRDELDCDRRGGAGARPPRRGRRGLRAPDLRRRGARPDQHPPGHGRAHRHHRLRGQVVQLHGVEGGMGDRAGAARRRGAHGQAVPDLRGERTVPVRRGGRPRAARTSTSPTSGRTCSASGTGWRTGWSGSASRCSARRGRTSSAPTSARWARRTAWRSAGPCPSAAAWWPCPTSSSTTTWTPADRWSGSRSASGCGCWRRPSSGSPGSRPKQPRQGRSVMRVAAIQHDIVWEDSAATCRHVEPLVAGAVASGAGLVVLTEMFATGFSMEAERIAEPEGGPTSTWIQEQASPPRRLAVRLGGRAPGRRRQAPQRRRAGRSGRDHAPLRQAPPLHVRPGARGLRRRRPDGHRRGRRAAGSASSSATTCASPTTGGRWPRPPTCTCAAPTGPRPAGPTGRPCSRPGPSRTRPTWSASTGSAKAAA